MSTQTMQDRLLMLIDCLTTQHRRFKQLEELTGIPADRWKAFGSGRQRPTAEMIEAIGKAFPKLVLWLVTGETELGAGQYDPKTFLAYKKVQMSEVVKKEPCDLTEEEMLVVEAESAQFSYASQVESKKYDPSDLWIIAECRDLNLTRSGFLAKWDEEGRMAAEEFQRQRDFHTRRSRKKK